MSDPVVFLRKFNEVLSDMEKNLSDIVATLAKKKLDNFIDETVSSSTADEYKSAIDFKTTTETITININPNNAKILSIENGITSFSIKDKMLKDRKAKTSKDGFLFRVIPIDKTPSLAGNVTANTAGEQSVQSLIQNALREANFSFQAAFQGQQGFDVIKRANDVGLQQRSTFASREDFMAGSKPVSAQLTLFRTMSNKPGSSPWQHPGTEGKNLLDKLTSWFENEEDDILNELAGLIIEELGI